MKMMLGWYTDATAKRVLTSFSPSPCHLLVKLLAEMEKNLERDSEAMARPIIVLPVPWAEEEERSERANKQKCQPHRKRSPQGSSTGNGWFSEKNGLLRSDR